MITVAGGLRPCGVLDGSGVQLELAREVMINHGLFTLKTKGVWSKNHVPEEYLQPELFLFLSNVVNQNAPAVLWFCTDREQRRRLKASPQTGSNSGRLLNYPLCCVSERVESEANYRIAILNAILQKVGDDNELVKRAILNGERVQVAREHVSLVPLSNEKFPFFYHVACAECCKNDKSPSALLDEQYQLLTKEIDPALHDAVVRVAKLIGPADAASSQADRDKLFQRWNSFGLKHFP